MSRFVIAYTLHTDARPIVPPVDPTGKTDATITGTFNPATYTNDTTFVGFDAALHNLPVNLHVYSLTEGGQSYTTADEIVQLSGYPHSVTPVTTADQVYALPKPTDEQSLDYVIAEYPA